jgi:hypothetical protein
MTKQPSKLDRILTELQGIKQVQTEQAAVLVDHSRRSTASEGRLSVLESFVAEVKTLILGAKWLCIGLAGFIAAVVGIAQLLQVIHSW